MAAIIELKYFNTFWLKKIKTITDVVPGTTTNNPSGTSTFTVAALTPAQMNVGQEITMNYEDAVTGDDVNYSSYIVTRIDDTQFTAANPATNYSPGGGPPDVMTFGKIINFDNIPAAYGPTTASDWLIEESRIRGGYNNTSVDFGVKAYLVEDEPRQSHKFSSLIHSGVFNSRTGFNATNQFSVGEDITRTIDPANGSIQKLYAEDTNLIIFQESKVSKSLIDKDAIYSAEGNASVTSRNLVIGVGPTPGGSGILGPIYNTLSFDESVKGWTSLFDYKPNQLFSINNDYFTTNAGKIYQHYALEKSTTARGVFYGVGYNSNVTFIFNVAPSTIKNFKTINYEGDTGWKMVSFNTNTDKTLPITEAVFATTLEQMQNALLINRFKLKEDKYFSDLVNSTSSQNGEVVFGGSSSGVKGFFGEVKMEVNNANNAKKELFAVSTGFVQSS